MIGCPVCGERNHHLATVCRRCGGFVQARVENLDLFATIWKVIERPRAAFHAIAIARYKNYATILAAVAGVGLVFAFFWAVKAGDSAGSAFNLVAGGLAAGPPAGVLLVLAASLLGWGALRSAGRPLRFRDLYAVLSYALVPVALSVVFVLPLEIFTFGRYFFSLNPPPWILKPVSYYLFLAIGWIVAAWTFGLVAAGFRALLDVPRGAALLLATGAALFVAGAGWAAAVVLTGASS